MALRILVQFIPEDGSQATDKTALMSIRKARDNPPDGSGYESTDYLVTLNDLNSNQITAEVKNFHRVSSVWYLISLAFLEVSRVED